MRNIELKYDNSTTAGEVLDQIVINWLKVMVVFCIKHNTDDDVLKACQILLEHMEDPYAQD